MAKLVKCKTCGSQIAKSAKRCPNCGARQHKGAFAAIAVVIVLAVVLIVVVSISGNDTKPSSSSAPSSSSGTAPGTAPSSSPAPAQDISPSPSDPEASELQLLDDDIISVSFVRLYEVAGVDGAIYLQLQMQNKTDSEIWVALTDGAANDEMIPTIGSGVPTYILPGKSSQNPFIIFTSALSISSASEIHDLTFTIYVEDRETGAELDRETVSFSIPK